MSTIMLDRQNTALREVADGVARALTSAFQDQDGTFVRTPVMYPGGTCVVVRLDQQHDGSFLVSDMGLAYQEADLMGAVQQFLRAAPDIGKRSGVSFDGNAYFIMKVRREQLVGAVSTVAACSQEAVQVTAFKLAERRTADASDRLVKRLERVFTKPKVARDAEIHGASETPYHVTALVRTDEHTAAFEAVTEHPTSIAATVTKFLDLSHLEEAPTRIAVVRSKERLGTRLTLITSTAAVVEETVPDGTLARLAMAA